jgi:hypothetical protein
MRSRLEVAAKQTVPAAVEDWAKGALRTWDVATAGVHCEPEQPTRF